MLQQIVSVLHLVWSYQCPCGAQSDRCYFFDNITKGAYIESAVWQESVIKLSFFVNTAACMTWELAESGVSFVTTVINGSDLVPSFCSASLDDLRTEVCMPHLMLM